MPQFTVIDAPSILGLWPSGVETLPMALKSAGLVTRLNAAYAGRVEPLPFSPLRDPDTLLLNGKAIASYSRQLADAIPPLIQTAQFPIVLGGDCSILIGAMLGLRRIGRYGLFFIDGHADFYQPEVDPYGEVASMELAIVTGHGPDLLTNLEGRKPLAREEDVIAFGYRDGEAALAEGSQDIRVTAIHTYDLAQTRSPDVKTTAQQAVAHLLRDDLDSFWIHVDADVLDDTIMPAGDYRMPDGLRFEELSATLQTLLATGKAVGMTITIFNPLLDFDGSIVRKFVDSIVSGLTGSPD